MSLWLPCAIIVSNTKVNLPQPLSLQIGCNQDDHPWLEQPTCFFSELRLRAIMANPSKYYRLLAQLLLPTLW